jgi:putative lipase involved disintegration of autophagic bodies
MATFDEYVDMANAAYGNEGNTEQPPGGWDTQKREWATWYGDGFQGAIFKNKNEVVVAFSGTKGGLTTAPVSQNSGNARIGVNVIPNMAGGAFAMVNWAKKHNPGKPISICGHSLGGGLAQVVGNWAGLPFVSFNGPGMKSHLKMSAFNIFKPQQMFRSATSKNTDDSIGICFTVKGDWIGEFGYHVGWEVPLPPASNGLSAHSMMAVFAGICSKQWRHSKPRDVYSIWPA